MRRWRGRPLPEHPVPPPAEAREAFDAIARRVAREARGYAVPAALAWAFAAALEEWMLACAKVRRADDPSLTSRDREMRSLARTVYEQRGRR